MVSMLNVFNIAGSALTAQSVRGSTPWPATWPMPIRSRRPRRPALPRQAGGVRGAPVDGGGLGVRVTGVVDSAAPLRIVYDPKNPAANKQGFVPCPMSTWSRRW
jgi:flagellar basal-body rod protein FlgC